MALGGFDESSTDSAETELGLWDSYLIKNLLLTSSHVEDSIELKTIVGTRIVHNEITALERNVELELTVVSLGSGGGGEWGEWSGVRGQGSGLRYAERLEGFYAPDKASTTTEDKTRG